METLKGKIAQIVYENGETGFKVLKVKMPKGPLLSIVGEFGPDIIKGTEATFHGDYKAHPKYGHNFKVSSYAITHNQEQVESLQIFLDCSAFNIGSERAHSIVKHFGDDLIRILDEEPQRLLEVTGIGEASAKSIQEAWEEKRQEWFDNRKQYDLRAFLNNLGIKERRVKKILAHFGRLDAEEKIRENPYILTEIEGFGFTTADFIAKQLGVPAGDPMRLKAFIHYLLEILCPGNGHLFLTTDEIVTSTNRYCDEQETTFLNKSKITVSDLEDPIKVLKSEKHIEEDGGAIYAKKCHQFETVSVNRLVKIMSTPSDLLFIKEKDVAKHIKNYEHDNDITLSAEQKKALHLFAEEKVFIITGGPGTGKCLGKDTPVMMFDGTIKKVQDVITGDLLMGDDSTPRKVLNTTSGREELFKVIPTKGDSYTVNKSHILSLKWSGTEKVTDICITDLLKRGKKAQDRLKGYRVPVSFQEKPVLIDPYLLGYWLGNGHSSGTGFATPFPEIVNHLSNIVGKIGLSVKKINGDDKYAYNITSDKKSLFYSELPDKRHPNDFLDNLKKLKLIDNKHIPLIYKTNSREFRLKVLAGLLDADGFYDERCNCYEFSQKSETLTKDVEYLARSLGFSAYAKTRIKKWNSFTKNKWYKGEGPYFIMHICGSGLEEIPTVVKKKKASKRKQIKDVLKTGIKIESIGEGDYYGFELDGNGRFLLGDFTVTHNTSILKAIVSLIKKQNLRLTCMTPTGISAKKMAETIEYDAYTIHRRLGFKGSSWDYNEGNKFETDVIIIDEISMVDQEVFYRLLCAVKDRVHIIMVGDHNQLPSVGAGNVLRELLNCEKIPTVRLEKIFRQNEASGIIKIAHQIKDGNPCLDLFKGDPKGDVFFYREDNIQKIEQFIVKLAMKFKEEKKVKFQILSPKNQGPLSVDALNILLQNVLNPAKEGLPERNCKGFILRKGDRIKVKKNDYINAIYNGDIGKVVSITSNFIDIEIDDRIIKLPVEEIDEKIKLAYSLSCHASQGQEYQYIILPFIKQHGKMLLQRNLLYTAITRAKQKVIILGHGSAIEMAIKNASVYQRNTKLGERIIECFQQKKKDFLPELQKVQENFQSVKTHKAPSLSETIDYAALALTDT